VLKIESGVIAETTGQNPDMKMAARVRSSLDVGPWSNYSGKSFSDMTPRTTMRACIGNRRMDIVKIARRVWEKSTGAAHWTIGAEVLIQPARPALAGGKRCLAARILQP
jgi:hypothetical protein